MGVVEKRRKWRYNNDALYCHSSPREQEHSPRRAGCCVILAEHWREAAGACGKAAGACGKAAGACGKAAGACGKAAGACGSLQQGAATPREILFQARWVIHKPYSFLFQVVYWWFHDPNLCKPQTSINSFFPFLFKNTSSGFKWVPIQKTMML
jgi:hypothetical protein